jgi:hypothetical protein
MLEKMALYFIRAQYFPIIPVPFHHERRFLQFGGGAIVYFSVKTVLRKDSGV